jgi:hypothetical protein
MKVKAIKLGYYSDKRRREDDVFFLKKPEDFSKLWMEKFEQSNDSKHKKKTEKVAEAVNLNDEVI